MPETIRIRPFEEADLDQALDVLRAALGETTVLQRTPELFAWKHLQNPFGRSIILVAMAGDRMAGLRAFMRWDLVTPDGDTIKCVRAVDTATHPDFHRMGIFSRLTTEAVERAESCGIDMIFNTPNPQSGAGYLKMGWTTVGSIGVLVRPSLRLLTKRRTGGEFSADRYLAPAVETQTFAGVDRPAIGLRTPRTADYRRWRFGGHPTARYYEVSAGKSISYLRANNRGGHHELVVSEVSGPEPYEAIRQAVRSSKADYLAGWWSKGTPERAAAVRSGLLPVPKKTALTLMCRALGELPIEVSTLASWDLALSDLELL